MFKISYPHTTVTSLIQKDDITISTITYSGSTFSPHGVQSHLLHNRVVCKGFKYKSSRRIIPIISTALVQSSKFMRSFPALDSGRRDEIGSVPSCTFSNLILNLDSLLEGRNTCMLIICLNCTSVPVLRYARSRQGAVIGGIVSISWIVEQLTERYRYSSGSKTSKPPYSIALLRIVQICVPSSYYGIFHSYHFCSSQYHIRPVCATPTRL